MPFENRPKSAGGESQVGDTARIDLHESAAGRVDRREVASHDDHACLFGRSHDGTISFHADNPIDDRQVGTHGRIDVVDRLGNAIEVQNVLRPAVADSRHDAEEVLHRKCRACPVVRLHFRQGDDPVDASERLRQVELSLFHAASGILGRKHAVDVQVDEGQLGVIKLTLQSALFEDIPGITDVSLPLGDDDFGSIQLQEDLSDRTHEQRMRVDVRSFP